MMETMKRRLVMMRGERMRRKPSVPEEETNCDCKQPRDSMRKTEFASRVSGSVQSATMPLKRLVKRVVSRLTWAKDSSQYQSKDLKRPTATDSSAAHILTRHDSSTHLAQLKFCIWEGTCTWSLKRRFLLDEALFVWYVSEVVSCAEVWESSGPRPGDVLETIGGIEVAALTREQDVITLLQAAVQGTVLRFRVRNACNACCLERIPVMVRGGVLGATIIADGQDAVPVVFHVSKEFQRDGSGGGIGGIQLGDVLCEVDGKKVLGWGMSRILTSITKCKPQTTLTFQRWKHDQCRFKCHHAAALLPLSPTRQSTRCSSRKWRFTGGEFHDAGDDEQDEVVISWRSGLLGLTLLNDKNAEMPVVNRLTGKGTADGIERVGHGFQLVSANGVSTRGHRFCDVVFSLQCMKKPLRLVFQPPSPPISIRTAKCCRNVKSLQLVHVPQLISSSQR